MTSKCIFCTLLLGLTVGASARTIVIPAQPVSPYADTEISTNVPINKADIGYSDVRFLFDGTPTNNLELAFGIDVNTNGVLEAAEVETRFGWRMGRYFIENTRLWERFDSAPSASTQNFGVEIHLEVRWGPQEIRKMTVSGLNSGGFEGLTADLPPAWIWRREWNLMRVTRRGTEPPSDWVCHESGNHGFTIKLR